MLHSLRYATRVLHAVVVVSLLAGSVPAPLAAQAVQPPDEATPPAQTAHPPDETTPPAQTAQPPDEATPAVQTAPLREETPVPPSLMSVSEKSRCITEGKTCRAVKPHRYAVRCHQSRL